MYGRHAHSGGVEPGGGRGRASKGGNSGGAGRRAPTGGEEGGLGGLGGLSWGRRAPWSGV